MKAVKFSHVARHLTALLLACLTLALLFSLPSIIHPKNRPPVEISIHSDQDTSSIENAIAALHRNDIAVHAYKDHFPPAAEGTAIIFQAVGFLLLTGVILFLYKMYCRLLRLPPAAA